MGQPDQGSNGEHAVRMDRMYRYQRHIYDLTRKYYLFGRDSLIRDLAVQPGGTVLEIGCGTGRNLALVRKHYPNARLFGLDISSEMIASAEKKLAGTDGPAPVLRTADASDFIPSVFGEAGFDRVVISYALSMIPDWERALTCAVDALNPGGSLHIVDFGQQENLPSSFALTLKSWLKRFHVTPRANLREALEIGTKTRDGDLIFRSIGRGYAWQAVFKPLAEVRT
ncbi:class I SAM-dependent methyltransferase [Pararhizobium sp.]|uniref:class I SAM-dependent methyltransferase n=1 Tax=Pararhizobium sp. TaxID=1977563 RepID=UPI00271F3D22|nr:class I SAM-dependent methyltransferase [Pararhizobium sp.]MDO9414585.1 class I SAM-dependent methyltransferase [Pararhizobium sp.]